MSHSYRTIPDARFEFDIFSIFGDMTHKLSLSKRGEKSSNLCIYLLKMGLNLKKMRFFVQGRSFQPKIDPLSISAISKQKKFLHFQNVLEISTKN